MTQKITATNDHYVPRAYLKGFTEDGVFCHVFNKFDGTTKKASTKSIASHTNFYTFPVDLISDDTVEEDLHSVEKALATIDGKIIPITQDVFKHIQSQTFINDTLREALAFWITIQKLRTYSFRKTFAEVVEKSNTAQLNNLFRDLKPEYVDRFKVDYNNELATIHHAEALFGDFADELAREYYDNYYWVIGINKTGYGLYTSDNPVADLYIEDPKNAEGTREIAFPLSPEHVILLREKSFFGPRSSVGNCYISLTETHVNRYDSLQVTQCWRDIYSQSSNFNIAREIRNQIPEACNPQRDFCDTEKFAEIRYPDETIDWYKNEYRS